MAGTLTVWKFPSETGADTAVHTLKELQGQRLIIVHDAATVIWHAGANKPRVRQLNNMAGKGALGGAFWGLLFGLLFFVPLLGAAVGASIGALTASLADVGIDDEFIARLTAQVTPGTSALFVLTSDATLDRLYDEFRFQTAELITTNLSHEQERTLREVFADQQGG